MREAVGPIRERCARAIGDIRAAKAILRKEPPAPRGCGAGSSDSCGAGVAEPKSITAVAALDESYLFIQGPPGAGKTFTGSHVIVELLRRGESASPIAPIQHKAIHNLLNAVERVAKRSGFEFLGVKKAARVERIACFNGQIIPTCEPDEATP